MNSPTPRKPYVSFLAGLTVALTVVACGGGGGGGPTPTPDPDPVSLDEPDDVMSALNNKLSSSEGALALVLNQQPPISNSLNPKANEIPVISATPGSTVTIPVVFSGTPDLDALFAKVPGAASYFTGEIVDAGGKSGAAIRAVRKAGEAEIPNRFQIDLEINLSGFQRGENQDQLCLDIKFSGGTLENGNPRVGELIPVCVKLVDEVPGNDQAADGDFKTALIGSWASECITDGEGSSAKLVFGFGQDVTFGLNIEDYASVDCSGTPEVAAAPGGVYELGDENFSERAGVWQREFTFFPDNIEGIDLEPCYNQIRVNGSKLYLGVPIPYTFDDGSAPQAGDCREASTRPDAVILGLPFTKR